MEKPPLGTKKRPLQSRSLETFNRIVETTAKLLDEVGFEVLSTNLICEKAGLTPPALYRYFPNKYAILQELADRIMSRQDEAVGRWVEAGGLSNGSVETKVERLVVLQAEVIELTRTFPGNVAILRAVRAAPALGERRIASRDALVRRVEALLGSAYPTVSATTLQLQSKLSIAYMCTVLEMVLDEPGVDAEAVVRAACHTLVGIFERLQDQACLEEWGRRR